MEDDATLKESPPESEPATADDNAAAPQAPVPGEKQDEGGSKFGVGRVLDRTFEALPKNFFLFFILSLVAVTPGAIAKYFLVQDSTITRIMWYSASNTLSLLLQSAIAYGVFQALRDIKVGFGGALTHGLSRLPTLIVLSILISLGTGLATLLFILPGIYLTCVWAVAIQACVVERVGAGAALDRSALLTRDHRWTITGLLLLFGVCAALFTSSIKYVVTAATHDPALALLISDLAAAVPGTFGNVMWAALYFELRVVKEGIDIDSLAKVFD